MMKKQRLDDEGIVVCESKNDWELTEQGKRWNDELRRERFRRFWSAAKVQRAVLELPEDDHRLGCHHAMGGVDLLDKHVVPVDDTAPQALGERGDGVERLARRN